MQAGDALLFCTIRATKQHAGFAFNAVTDNPAAAVIASWRQSMDRALEAVERVLRSANTHLECLVILIAANFTSTHGWTSPTVRCNPFSKGKNLPWLSCNTREVWLCPCIVSLKRWNPAGMRIAPRL
jgi:hypothetical protein